MPVIRPSELGMYATWARPMKGTRWCSQSEAKGMSRTMTISSWSAAKVTVRWRPGSSFNPAKSSSYMAATRDGVSTNPSREGFSPMASRISATAFSTRAWSTPIRPASAPPGVGAVEVDRAEVPVPLVDVEPVADHELRGDLEADVAQIEGHALLPLLHQQGADLEAGRAARLEVPAQVVEGEAAVDDVLDDQHVAAGQVGVEVLHDPDHARGAGRAPVRRDRHKVDVDREVDHAGEIAHEDHGALQDPDEERRFGGVVGGDGGAQLCHPRGQSLGGDHRLAHLGRDPARHRRSGTLRLHRRNLIGLTLDGQARCGATHPSPARDLRRHAVAGRDVEDAGDLGGRGWMAIGATVGRRQ